MSRNNATPDHWWTDCILKTYLTKFLLDDCRKVSQIYPSNRCYNWMQQAQFFIHVQGALKKGLQELIDTLSNPVWAVLDGWHQLTWRARHDCSLISVWWRIWVLSHSKESATTKLRGVDQPHRTLSWQVLHLHWQFAAVSCERLDQLQSN